jgi:hypothetical protein
LAIGAILGLSACGATDGDSSARPSAGASIDRPSREPDAETDTPEEPARTNAQPERSREPARTTEPEPPETAVVPPPPTRAPRTTPPAEAAPPPAQTATPPAAEPPPAKTPAPSVSAAAAAAESDGVGPYGWLVLIGLVAAIIIGGLLFYRSRRKTDWDAEAGALEAETRNITTTRLPPVLTATTAGQRGLAWPPVRASLVDLVERWNALAERASGEPRRNRSLQISGLLQDLIAAVDAENEALAVGRDWTLLRPRVIQADQALAATLANQWQPEPPPFGEQGPPAYQP